MKQMISVLSNTHYTQEENDKEFVLKPMMELIIKEIIKLQDMQKWLL